MITSERILDHSILCEKFQHLAASALRLTGMNEDAGNWLQILARSDTLFFVRILLHPQLLKL